LAGSTESTASPPLPRVAVLLCTYNGEQFLREQLDSIGAQTLGGWKVWVSDDGSSDCTLEILSEYRQAWGPHRLEIVRGPGRGFAANFLSLVCRHEISGDYFAYADQDDVWATDKLERALEHLERIGPRSPSLYCSRTILVDETNVELGLSPLFTQKPDFKNALVQNVGGGNTMVFSSAARQMLMRAGPDLNVVAHDWWTYLVVTAVGGEVIYDAWPTLRYRQHGGNLIGSNRGWQAHLHRLKRLLHGQFGRWIDANAVGLGRLATFMSARNRAIFEEFEAARRGSLVERVSGLRRSGVYRQTLSGNVGLIVAAFFNKL
jgi:glycosyltransferase involved in cell wall biosynthesis